MFLKNTLFLSILLVLINFSEQHFKLEDYVYSNGDQHFMDYKLVRQIEQEGFITYILNITTIKWFDSTLSTRPIWWHYLYVNIPYSLTYSQKIAFLYIDNGSNNDRKKPISFINQYVSKLTLSCNCITATLGQIPNQPIRFRNDPSQSDRYEDAIIAWTFKLYLDQMGSVKKPPMSTGYMPLLVPMTKATVRTMDIIQKFISDLGMFKPEKFILSGESKRGWTAWLTATVDKRVVSVVPIVFDFANIRQNIHKTYRSLDGGYSYEFSDYYAVGLDSLLDTREFMAMSQLIDPYYRFEELENVTVFLILAANDEFMMQDNVREFWDMLKVYTNEKCFLRRLPNTGHDIMTANTILQVEAVMNSIELFLLTFIEPKKYILPQLSWNFDNNNTHATINLFIENPTCPTGSISVYMTNTLDEEKRDFRASRLYDSTSIEPQTIPWKITQRSKYNLTNSHKTSYQTKYTIEIKNPNQYWTAFYMEVNTNINKNDCRNPYRNMFIMTTETNIVPNIYPEPDCFGKKCFGPLV